jgi:hypothetical protein
VAQLQPPSSLGLVFGLVGLGAAIACAGLAGWSGWRTIVTRGRSMVHATVFILSSFSLLFAINVVIGRTCLGPSMVGASRYTPYVIPFVLAAYLAITAAADLPRARLAVVAAFCVLCIVRELLVGTGTAEYFAEDKRAFQLCYLQTLDAAGCGRLAPLYFGPEETHMGAKLHYLREGQLSFFKRR